MPTLVNYDPGVLSVLFDANPLPMAMFYADTMELFAVNDAWRRIRGNGSLLEVEIQRSRQFVHEGRAAHLATCFDVSERKRAAESLHANSILLETADGVTGIETFSLDLRTGEQENPSRGAPLMTRPTAGDVPHSIADQQPFESDFAGGAGDETRWFHSGTQLVYGEDGEPTHIVGVTADVTERRAMADQLLARAYRDVQTGLPNREAMLLDGITLTESTTGMLLVHTHMVAGFAERDHDLKTRVMQEAARVIVEIASSAATVVRYADEVFAVVTSQRGRNRSLVLLAKRLLRGFEQPLRIGDEESVVNPSIGIAAERGQRRDATLLCHEAECALDVARHNDSHIAV
ncbi:MAG: hypothetical protein JWO85_485, partial [Candidatus Eremiobacteraeota bacterium]|nr:hypothetical protein [Candidatus Eremiobacteraeota bacterium]